MSPSSLGAASVHAIDGDDGDEEEMLPELICAPHVCIVDDKSAAEEPSVPLVSPAMVRARL